MRANSALVLWHGGWIEVNDPGYNPANDRRSEQLLNYGHIILADEASRVGTEEVTIMGSPTVEVDVTIDPPTETETPWLSYVVGDTVVLDGDTTPVVGIVAGMDDDGRWRFTPQFGVVVDAEDQQIDRALKRMVDGTARGFSKVASPITMVRTEDKASALGGLIEVPELPYAFSPGNLLRWPTDIGLDGWGLEIYSDDYADTTGGVPDPFPTDGAVVSMAIHPTSHAEFATGFGAGAGVGSALTFTESRSSGTDFMGTHEQHAFSFGDNETSIQARAIAGPGAAAEAATYWRYVDDTGDLESLNHVRARETGGTILADFYNLVGAADTTASFQVLSSPSVCQQFVSFFDDPADLNAEVSALTESGRAQSEWFVEDFAASFTVASELITNGNTGQVTHYYQWADASDTFTQQTDVAVNVVETTATIDAAPVFNYLDLYLDDGSGWIDLVFDDGTDSGEVFMFLNAGFAEWKVQSTSFGLRLDVQDIATEEVALRTTGTDDLSLTENTNLRFINNSAVATWIVNNSGQYIEGLEVTAPAAPGTNRGRLFFQDNGAGKTQLAVRFNTGAVQVIATEP